MTSLVSLPTEILVAILDDQTGFWDETIPTETLYGLALLCRRLHFIALPIYLAREGLQSDSTAAEIHLQSDGKDVARGLQIALFPLQIEEATFHFPHPSCISIVPLLSQLHRVAKLISRLPPLKSVTLILDSDPKSICLSVGKDEHLKAWASNFQHLLNSIVSRGCASLSVVNGAQFTKAYQLIPAVAGVRNIPHLQAMLSAILPWNRKTHVQAIHSFQRNLRFGHKLIEMEFAPTLRGSPAPTFLRISSAILVVPPGLSWTLDALEHCAITSLSVRHNGVDYSIWRTVLPLFASAAASKLTSLELLGAEFVYPQDALTFISQLPLLSHLVIGTWKALDLRGCHGPRIRLPRLETLHAPPTFLHHFFAHKRPRSDFPVLASIAVIWPADYLDLGPSAVSELFDATMGALARSGAHPELSLAADLRAQRGGRGALSAQDLPADGAFLAHLVALDLWAPLTPVFDVPDIAAWIARCPHMRRVEVAISKSCAPAEHVRRLQRELRATAYLKQFAVNGDTYDIGVELPAESRS